MAGNMEGNDSTPPRENPTTNLYSHAFSSEDQAVVKKVFQSSDVGGLALDHSESAQKALRSFGMPHNWYEASTKASYNLPAEALLPGGVSSVIKAGWRKLNA